MHERTGITQLFKRCKRSMASISIVAIIMLGVTAFVSVASSFVSQYLPALISLAAVALITAYLAYRLRRIQIEKKRFDQIIEFLYNLYYLRQKHTLASNMYMLASGIGNVADRQKLNEMANGIRLGGDFADLIYLQFEPLLNEFGLSRPPSCHYPNDQYQEIRELLDSYESNEHPTLEASMQRYSTVNMFISTILPIFIMFIFIGSSIISQSGINKVEFSLIILTFIPAFYAVGNAIFIRRYIVEAS
ncbi:MAG: hypothetical protein ACP5MK_02195 [Candidatus Micrarchaeia archaeon]